MTKLFQSAKPPSPQNPIEKHFLVISKYHYYLWIQLFLSKFALSLHGLSLVFLSPPMDFKCYGFQNMTNNCPCDTPVWNRSVFTETIETKYNLHCHKKWMISFSESIFCVGLLIGAFIFGILSDK